NETNNNQTNTTTAQGRPDLTPTTITTPTNPYTGLTYPINVTIANVGDATAGTFTVELFDGANSLGTKNITNLGIGSTTILTWNWIPLTVRTHTLPAIIDTLNTQYEINETNNEINQPLTAINAPDIVPSNLQIPTPNYLNITYPI